MSGDDAGQDSGGGDFDFGKKTFDAGVEASEETDPTKFIQQLSGKLGQSIRDYSEKNGQADLELEKFAINSVISATHTGDMTDEDKNDIIKKIETSGSSDTPSDDDFGDTPDGEEETGEEDMDFGGTDESVIYEFDENNPSGCLPLEMQFPNGYPKNENSIGILPKDHKQVFVNAKLGVDELENKKMDESLSNNLNLSIFTGDKIRNFIQKKINEMQERPVVEPVVVPVVKPDEQPTRRQKPWKVRPNISPEPKLEK